MVNDIFGANYSGLVKEFIVTAELDMLIETPEYKSAPDRKSLNLNYGWLISICLPF